MASRNKLLPVWGSHLGNSRACLNSWWGIHVNGKGVLFFFNGQKILRFPILSANPTCVSSLEISKRTISPENTRSYQPYNIRTKKTKTIFTRGGVLLWTGKKIKDFQFCLPGRRIFPWNFLTDNFPWKYQVISARQNWNQRKKNVAP